MPETKPKRYTNGTVLSIARHNPRALAAVPDVDLLRTVSMPWGAKVSGALRTEARRRGLL